MTSRGVPRFSLSAEYPPRCASARACKARAEMHRKSADSILGTFRSRAVRLLDVLDFRYEYRDSSSTVHDDCDFYSL